MSRRDAACGEDGEREAGRFKRANAFVGMDAFDVLRFLSLLSSPSSPSFASHLHEPIPSQTSSFPSPSLSLSLTLVSLSHEQKSPTEAPSHFPARTDVVLSIQGSEIPFYRDGQ